MSFLAEVLLSPPGVALFFLTISLLYALLKKRGKSILFSCVALVLGWVMSTDAFGRFLTAGLIAQIETRQDILPQDIDMIVVLAGGITYSGQIGWLPTYASYRRMAVAVDAQAKINSRLPILVSGGKTKGTKHPSEAEVIVSQFDRQNAQILPMVIEDVSTNTYENALQSAHIVRSRGSDNVLLVTSEEHMLRALAAFRGRGIDPIALPVFTIERGPLQWQDFFPTAGGARTTTRALHEIYGILNYLLTDKIRYEDVFYSREKK